MHSIEFIEETINKLTIDSFEQLKNIFIEKYISFSIIKKENVDKVIFSEKLCDYIEKLELKTGDDFDKCLNKYTNELISLVKKNIEDDSRAKRYFDLALNKADSENINLVELVDLTRIMLCLYSEIIKKKDMMINNFDLSIRNINLENILSKMNEEKVPEFDIGLFNVGSKKRFNTEAPYCFDTLFFMLITLFCYYLKDTEVKGV